jgi:heavy metal sensor kinase
MSSKTSRFWNPLKSIRAKLTFWYSFVLLGALVAFGLIAYTYSREQLIDSLDRSLSNEVKWVKTSIEQQTAKVKPSRKFTLKKKTPPPPPQAGLQAPEQVEAEQTDADDAIWDQIYEHALLNSKKTLIEVTDKKGAVVFRSFTAGEESLMVGDVALNTLQLSTVKTERGENLRVASTATKDIRIYVAYPLAELREVLDNLFSIFLVLIPIALALSIAGGWFLAYESLKPVDAVTRTARQITAQNLDQRIPERGVNDEIGRLISTFNGMIARLHRSFEQIRQFSVDASHELRTPLTIMRGEVELALRHSKDPEEYRRILVSNLEEIVRLSTITENLLTLSKAELGQQEVLSREHFNLREMIGELFEDSEIIALKKEIAIVLEKNEEISLHGDPLRLRQLFLNLIDNAIKYTPERGKVTLSSESVDGFARIQVRDTGIGIPKDEQRKIFDRFYRVDKARSRELGGGGSGLGLTIAKWIAELHRGRIEVESEPGQGSAFSVYLPLG